MLEFKVAFMRKTISMYWPVAILLPIALVFALHARENDERRAVPREATSIASVSAELARAISYGFVEADETPASAPLTQTL
jgi:stringent starvation protein B